MGRFPPPICDCLECGAAYAGESRECGALAYVRDSGGIRGPMLAPILSSFVIKELFYGIMSFG